MLADELAGVACLGDGVVTGPREFVGTIGGVEGVGVVVSAFESFPVVEALAALLVLSKGASYYVRIITGLPVADPTGGFKCFRRRVLEAIELDRVRSNGYAFQIEMTYKVWMQGFRIREIPITFVDRYAGQSKMSGHIVREALWMVWALAFSQWFRRKPRKRI